MSGTSCSRKYAKHTQPSVARSSGNGCAVMFGIVILLAGILFVLASSGIH